jgi:Na+:H+ antiporter
MVLLELSGTNLLVALLGITLLVGFGADWLASRFRVPDVLWLIALGLLAGPILGLISSTSLLLVAPLLGTAALILILFDAGIDLQLSLIRPLAGSAVLFAITSYAVSTAVIFAVSYLVLFPGHPILSLLFGAALGCTSGAVIIPLANRLGLAEGLRSLLHLDAAIEDAVAIIAVTTILLLIAPSSPNLALTVTASLILPLPVGVAVGFGAGLVWLLFLYGWQNRPFAALATLGFLFSVYAIAEALGGSGILAAIVFGGVLGNEPIFRRFLRRSRSFRISSGLRSVELEIAFVLRAFFLFLIGTLVVLSVPALGAGVALLALTVVLLGLRRGIFPWVTNARNVPRQWANSVAGLYGRGLTSAVLLIVAFQTVPASAALLLPALLLIVGTNVAMTVWLSVTPPAPSVGELDAERRWAEVAPLLLTLAEEDGALGVPPAIGGPRRPPERPPPSALPDPSGAVPADDRPAEDGPPPLPTRPKRPPA